MAAGLATVYQRARGTGLAAQVLSTPIAPGRGPYGSAEMGGGRPGILNIDRSRDGTTGALDGTIAVLGAMVPDSDSGNPATVQRFVALGSTNLFDTDGVILTYAAPVPALLNWLVRIGGKNGLWAIYNSSPSTNVMYGVTNPSGNVARITIGGANLVAGTIVEVFKVTPVVMLAAAANDLVRQEVPAIYDVVWCSEVPTSTNQSATLVTLEPEF